MIPNQSHFRQVNQVNMLDQKHDVDEDLLSDFTICAITRLYKTQDEPYRLIDAPYVLQIDKVYGYRCYVETWCRC
jgi:hypothetical protein